ncbi:MAG: polysaccharide deacetylase family protein [Halanaerobiales bacterium]
MKKTTTILLFIVMLLIQSPMSKADFKIILNFDDGYEGVFTNAFPIMQKYNIPAVVFVITNQINRDRHLSTEQLHILKNANWEIGSHTICHYDLTKIIPTVQSHEIKGSRDQLRELGLIDDFYSSFSSPNERWNPAIERLVSETYQIAREKQLYIFRDNHLQIEKTIHQVVVKNTNTDHLRLWINEAKTRDIPLVLVLHDVAEGENVLFYSPDKFEELVREISKYDVITFRDFYFSR